MGKVIATCTSEIKGVQKKNVHQVCLIEDYGYRQYSMPLIGGSGRCPGMEVSQQRGLSGIPTRFPFHPCPVRRTGKPVSKGKYNNITFLSREKWQTNQFFLRAARYSSSGMTFSTWPLSSKATTRFR